MKLIENISQNILYKIIRHIKTSIVFHLYYINLYCLISILFILGEDEFTKSLSSFKRAHNDSDDPRSQNKHSRTRMDSDSDCSPPRKSHNNNSSRHDSGSDASPPRNPKKYTKSIERHDSDSNMSPPRRNNKNRASFKGKQDLSRRNKKTNSDSDLSPERQRGKKESLPRRTRGSDSDLSPPRKSAGRNQNSRGIIFKYSFLMV